MTTGEKIARTRKEKNMTQEQLADVLGVTRQSVSRWESDSAYPDMEKIIRLAEILKVSCDYLLKDGVNEKEGTKVAVSSPVTRLLKKALGKKVKLQLTDDDVDFMIIIGSVPSTIIKEFDGAWARVEYAEGNKRKIKLIPVSSIVSISFSEEED